MAKRGSYSSRAPTRSPTACAGWLSALITCAAWEGRVRNARDTTRGTPSSLGWMTTSTPLADTGRGTLARNAAYNLVGQVLPLAVGVVTLPVAARYLGAERFGVLGLVWALVGSFGLLDLGLGRATTKHVAASLARNDFTTLGSVTPLSVVVQTGLGVLGGIVLALLTPWLVGRAMSVPAPLQAEVRSCFLVLAVSIPFVSVSASLRGILEAALRFDLVNVVRAPMAAAMFAVPAIVAAAGGDLVAITAGLLAIRLFAAWAWVRAVRSAVPGLRWQLEPSWVSFRPLVAYGAWTAVSNTVNPLLLYLERFLLASLAGVAAVGYYTGPAEAVGRLLIVPAALAGALFPAVSAADGRTSTEAEGTRLAFTSLRFLVIGLVPIVTLLIILAEPLLRLWLGTDYATQGATAFAILAVGARITGFAPVPPALLYGRGRPDLPAKFHLVELPLYVLGAWLLIRAYGITGAALAWTLRVSVDAVLLGAAMWRVSEPARLSAGQ